MQQRTVDNHPSIYLSICLSISFYLPIEDRKGSRHAHCLWKHSNPHSFFAKSTNFHSKKKLNLTGLHSLDCSICLTVPLLRNRTVCTDEELSHECRAQVNTPRLCFSSFFSWKEKIITFMQMPHFLRQLQSDVLHVSLLEMAAATPICRLKDSHSLSGGLLQVFHGANKTACSSKQNLCIWSLSGIKISGAISSRRGSLLHFIPIPWNQLLAN